MNVTLNRATGTNPGVAASNRSPPRRGALLSEAATLILKTLNQRMRSDELTTHLDSVGMPRSTRSYHLRALADNGLINVEQGWHETYPHVRVYTYSLTPVGKGLFDAIEKMQQQSHLNKPTLASLVTA